MLPITECILKFILNASSSIKKKPLIVGLQGCQGSGKTTIAMQLKEALARENMKSVFVSMDDLYLTFKDQQEVAARTRNKLLEFRGCAGTHDLKLGSDLMSKLSRGLPSTIPRYDKSLNGGRGDRAPIEKWETVEGGIDVVLFEGWSLGFKHISSTAELLERFTAVNLAEWGCSKEDLEQINANLEEYSKHWYPYLDLFVQVKPADIHYVYKWREQQEEALRKSMNTAGLSKSQVVDFVNRFMPMYHIYLEKLSFDGFFGRDCPDRSLQICIDSDRTVLSSRII